MSETLVEHALLALGYNVSRPLAVARYDVIAERDGRCYRVQTKTGRIDPRSNALKASFETPYTPDEVDVIAVVDLDAACVYYVKASSLVAGVTNVTLAFEERRTGSTAFEATACMAWPFDDEANETKEGNE